MRQASSGSSVSLANSETTPSVPSKGRGLQRTKIFSLFLAKPNVFSIQIARGLCTNSSAVWVPLVAAKALAISSLRAVRNFSACRSSAMVLTVSFFKVSTMTLAGCTSVPNNLLANLATSIFCSAKVPGPAKVADVPMHWKEESSPGLASVLRRRRMSMATSAPWRPR